MSTESSETDSEDQMDWSVVESEKKKRKKRRKTKKNSDLIDLQEERINEIIGISQTQENVNIVKTGDKIYQNKDKETRATLSNPHDKNNDNQANKYKHKNFSAKMQEIINQKFHNLFYLNAPKMNRIEMADIWNTERPNSKDVIIQTSKGFLLKSNTPKVIITGILSKLKKSKTIDNFSETTDNKHSRNEAGKKNESYSAIISQVEKILKDETISTYLTEVGIEHRYCKRIISRNTGNPTSLVRVITGQIAAYERLINGGLFYKNRHYPVYESTPPKPAPLPCRRCLQFTHETENCTSPIRCDKCTEAHSTNKCTKDLPIKCRACDATDHQAWAFKCPKRPTQPLEGIPNIPISSLNKKSNKISCEEKKKSIIHAPITIHDHIINTYIRKLNKPKNTNREELIVKLKKRFIKEYNIDTSLVFPGGNKVFIFMFDLDCPETISPTEPIQGNTANININIH